MSQFKIGDRVFWTSQSGGRSKRKEGAVFEIVTPHETPEIYRRSNGQYRLMFDGMGRSHKSYVVAVSPGGRGKTRLYWPRVSQLKLVER